MLKYLIQILSNQIVLMGMLQDLQNELKPVQNIEETHQLIISSKNLSCEI